MSAHGFVLDRLKRRLKKKLKPCYCRLQQWGNRGVFAIDLQSPIGFFGQLTNCLLILAYCRQHDLRPYLVLSGSSYLDPERGGNWFDYFFEQPTLRDTDRKMIADGRIAVSRVWLLDELGITRRTSSLTIADANGLLTKYVRIRPEILTYVDSFVHNNFAGKSVVGIHYRGTDKTSEAPRVDKAVVRRTVLAYLNDHPETDALYVASDEKPFIDWSRTVFGSIPIIVHPDNYRSPDNRSVHEGLQGDGVRKGWEALVNSLLLSRCAALIRTSSFLSAWASVFTPSLPVVLLNKPYPDKLWFPECEIAKRSLDQYVDQTRT